MTLFALDVRVPDSVPDTPEAFDDEFPDLLSHFGVFAAAFFITASFWFTHHRLMSRVERIDGATTQITVAFLFGIAATPVASSSLIRFGDAPHAVIFASVLLSFTTFMHLLLLRHVSDPALGLSDIDPESRRVTMRAVAWAAVTFLLAIPLALVLPDPSYAMLTWLIILLARRGLRTTRGDPPLAA